MNVHVYCMQLFVLVNLVSTSMAFAGMDRMKLADLEIPVDVENVVDSSKWSVVESSKAKIELWTDSLSTIRKQVRDAAGTAGCPGVDIDPEIDQRAATWAFATTDLPTTGYCCPGSLFRDPEEYQCPNGCASTEQAAAAHAQYSGRTILPVDATESQRDEAERILAREEERVLAAHAQGDYILQMGRTGECVSHDVFLTTAVYLQELITYGRTKAEYMETIPRLVQELAVVQDHIHQLELNSIPTAQEDCTGPRLSPTKEKPCCPYASRDISNGKIERFVEYRHGEIGGIGGSECVAMSVLVNTGQFLEGLIAHCEQSMKFFPDRPC